MAVPPVLCMENSKNSKNFRELQALDFVASFCALDRLHLETNGCGLGGVVGRSARHSDSILADLTRAEFEKYFAWTSSRSRRYTARLIARPKQDVRGLRAYWGVQRVDLADLVAKSPDLFKNV